MADRSLAIPPLRAVSPFERLAVPAPRAGAGVTVFERRGLGLATVTPRRGAGPDFAARVRQAFGIELAPGPKVSSGDGLAFVGTGPESFLGVKAGGGWGLAPELRRQFSGLAAVADQSSGYGVLRLEGPRVRDLLAKGVPIDLDPVAFRPGDAAVTLAGHVGIVLWQVDAAPRYDLAAFRSHAADLWHWLETGAAEFGLAVAEPEG